MRHYRPKVCPQCGKEFLPTSPSHTFCSKSCRAVHLQTRKPPKVQTAYCLTCGKAFAPYNRNHKYCSKPCYPSKQKYITAAKPTGGKNRPFTRDTLMWIDLWLRRGESVKQIADDLGRSVENVLFAKSEIARIKSERGTKG